LSLVLGVDTEGKRMDVVLIDIRADAISAPSKVLSTRRNP